MIVGKSYCSVYNLHNFSPLTLEIEYVFKQSSGCVSIFGYSLKPYAEDV